MGKWEGGIRIAVVCSGSIDSDEGLDRVGRMGDMRDGDPDHEH